MEPFRQMGEVLGSLRAQLLFESDLRLNRHQCRLLRDALELAFDAVFGEIRRFLRFDERHIKWGALDHPLRELLRVFREADNYVRACMAATAPEAGAGGCGAITTSTVETPAWWARALLMGRAGDCLEMLVHDLVAALPAVFEAAETAGEIAGRDYEEMRRKRLLVAKTYDKDWLDPVMFRLHHVGRRYLASPEFHARARTAWADDQRALAEAVAQRKARCCKDKATNSSNDNDSASRLADVLAGGTAGRFLPTRLLLGNGEYTVRRRLGSGSHLKEVQWLGEGFAVHHTFGDVAPLAPEIATLSSLAEHPNVAGCLCAFSDEDRRECYLVTELMARDLGSHVKEMVGPRRRAVPFQLHVAVDVMLQVARGMEFLHSRKVCHGNLNPANVLVKPRAVGAADGYLLVKVAGLAERFLPPLGKRPGGGGSRSPTTHGSNPVIWWAPEVLEEEEELQLQLCGPRGGEFSISPPPRLTATKPSSARYTEKADVYSYGMLCFELLTGKVPFEDGHMQGDKASRNVRAGERPLFPSPSPPKFLTALTKRCWQPDPTQRPGFSVLCRALRYVKRHLLLNPSSSDQKPQAPPPPPLPDLFEMDAALFRRVPEWGGELAGPGAGIAQVPFQMFAYRVVERERGSLNCPSPSWKNASSESGSDGSASMSGEDPAAIAIFPEDSFPSPSRTSPPKPAKNIQLPTSKKLVANGKAAGRSNSARQYHSVAGPLKSARSPRPPPIMSCASLRIQSDTTLLQPVVLSLGRRRTSGHASDSELP